MNMGRMMIKIEHPDDNAKEEGNYWHIMASIMAS
jgi:hypothetical protein